MAWIWQALERINSLTVALWKRRVNDNYISAYAWLQMVFIIIISYQFSSMPILSLHPWFFHYFHIIFMPIFFYCRFCLYYYGSPVILISPIFFYSGFILSIFSESKKAGLTHKLGRTRASEGGKKMMKANMAWIWQALEMVNNFIVASRKGVQMIVIN
jgi:hypothetical protein